MRLALTLTLTLTLTPYAPHERQGAPNPPPSPLAPPPPSPLVRRHPRLHDHTCSRLLRHPSPPFPRWYSVYDSDVTMCELILDAARRIDAVNGNVSAFYAMGWG